MCLEELWWVSAAAHPVKGIEAFPGFTRRVFSAHSVFTCLLTGREYTIPSPLQRFLAETLDFIILFCIKATIVLWIMHLSGMKWVKQLKALLLRNQSVELKKVKRWDFPWKGTSLSSLLKGHCQIYYTVHCGGDRWEHVDGRPAEDDGGGSGLQGGGVRLWGETHCRHNGTYFIIYHVFFLVFIVVILFTIMITITVIYFMLSMAGLSFQKESYK